jgi:hypothetical protein
MKEEEKKILNDSLSKLFKLDSEKLASLYNEAGDLVDFSVVEDADSERVSKFSGDKDSQYRRGIKEGAEKIEKAIKEKYELESDAVGIDLVDQLVVKQVETVKSSSTKDITKHPDYIALQVSIEKEKKAIEKEWEKKLEAKDLEFAQIKLFEKVASKALSNLESRNPILPQDARKARAWKEVYLNELKTGKYQLGDSDSIIVLDAEGNIMKDSHGHPVTFDDFEKEIADKYFDYQVAQARTSTGNKQTTQAAPNGNGFVPPKDESEYIARLRDPKITPEQRIELTEFWTNKS